MFSYKNRVVQKDLEFITDVNLNFEKFRNKTVLITGINGMLATNLAFAFLFLNDKFNFNISIIGLGRNRKEFESRFDPNLKKIYFIEQDINEKIQVTRKVDFIFHAATNASPENMTDRPVSIAVVNTLGTINVAEFALENDAYVHFLSTREIYGSSNSNQIKETSDSLLNSLDIRNVYPISKLSAESILLAYKKEHNLSISISRIAHAYGPGMKLQNDGRVMADFIGKVVRSEDIILNSDGNAERAFIYTRDAILGILFIVLKYSASNFTFNLSNETEPIRIKNLAHLVRCCGEKFDLESNVTFSTNHCDVAGYSKVTRTPLNTENLESLGWKPSMSLKMGICNTFEVYSELEGNDD